MRMSRYLTCLLVIGFLAAAAPADVSFDWVQVDTGVGDGGLYDSYDLMMDVDTEISLVQLHIESYAPAAGDFHINTTDPYLEDETYDTYITLPSPIVFSDLGMVYVRPGDDGNNAPATDIVPGTREQSFNNSGLIGVDGRLDISWGAADGTNLAGSGQHKVARVTVKQGLWYGSWQVCGYETDAEPYPKYSASGVWPLYSMLPADFNINYEVDNGDYTIWAGTYLSTKNLQADANHNGEIDNGDYTIWAGSYLDTWSPPEPSEPSSVPEPATICLLAVGLAAVICKRK